MCQSLISIKSNVDYVKYSIRWACLARTTASALVGATKASPLPISIDKNCP